MEQEEYDDLVRRLTTLIVKLDERLDHIMELIEKQQEFNKQQVEINARLETLMMRVFQERSNGQD